MGEQQVLRAYVSLGSNCEAAAAMLEAARAALAALPDMHMGTASPVYRTEPQEYADQPWFLNQVVELFPGEVWQPCSLVDALLELADRQITVNAVAPGVIVTDMLLERAEGLEGLRVQQPSGKLGTPEDIAHAVAFFADPRASFVTGQVLLVDGGRSVGGTAAF